MELMLTFVLLLERANQTFFLHTLQLAEHIGHKIFRHLIYHGLENVRQTCTFFDQICQKIQPKEFQHELDITQYNDVKDICGVIDSFVAMSGNVKLRMNAVGNEHHTKETLILKCLEKNYRSLRCVEFDSFQFVLANSVSKKFEKVTEAKFVNCTFNFTTVTLLNLFVNLKTLTIQNCQFRSGIKAVQGISKLQTLHYIDNIPTTKEYFFKGFLTKNKMLENINLFDFATTLCINQIY